jgi:hypothetical protein
MDKKLSEKEREVLKEVLKTLLIGLDGNCSVRTLGSAYTQNFGKFIDLKVNMAVKSEFVFLQISCILSQKYGASKFTELLKSFNDVVKVYNKAGNIFVKLVEG